MEESVRPQAYQIGNLCFSNATVWRPLKMVLDQQGISLYICCGTVCFSIVLFRVWIFIRICNSSSHENNQE